ncbi:phosphonopyruvate decarboxylase [Candidatus Pelagibacter sp.]|uniref:phosphonopyruvate decarboxylase n=1 Tax=Candidatus Pelagibacter sp. TaxID=2024849 RepID=UPI003F866166
MINVNSLVKILKQNSCDFYTGVPDSVLKELSYYLQKNKNHVIATNEGSAVSIGIGHYLSTKKIPCVYMQNSGLSNALNPLISIAHKKVYNIPLILLIGWRGSPNIKDEPQHNVKGKITREILKLLNIKYVILKTKKDLETFNQKIKISKKNNTILAGLIEMGTLEKSKTKKQKGIFNLDKELFFKTLLENLDKKMKVISSTGYNSRELMYVRKKYNLNKGKDFYMVGGMGHTSSVALGYSLKNKKKIICIDGDGSFLMHLGSIKTIGSFAKKNLKYILLNNNTHDSVGGQETFVKNIELKKFSKSLGFKNFYEINKKDQLKKIIKKFIKNNSLDFLEVKVSNSKISKLPRPSDLIKIKKEFMNND